MAYLFIQRQGISSHLQTIWGARVFHPPHFKMKGKILRSLNLPANQNPAEVKERVCECVSVCVCVCVC